MAISSVRWARSPGPHCAVLKLLRWLGRQLEVSGVATWRGRRDGAQAGVQRSGSPGGVLERDDPRLSLWGRRSRGPAWTRDYPRFAAGRPDCRGELKRALANRWRWSIRAGDNTGLTLVQHRPGP